MIETLFETGAYRVRFGRPAPSAPEDARDGIARARPVIPDEAAFAPDEAAEARFIPAERSTRP